MVSWMYLLSTTLTFGYLPLVRLRWRDNQLLWVSITGIVVLNFWVPPEFDSPRAHKSASNVGARRLFGSFCETYRVTTSPGVGPA